MLVCNVATQRHETDGFDAADHLAAFQAHSGVSVSHFLVNSEMREVPGELNQAPVSPVSEIEGFGGAVVSADMVNEDLPVRHDSHKLADALMGILRDGAGRKRAFRPAASARPVSAGGEG